MLKSKKTQSFTHRITRNFLSFTWVILMLAVCNILFFGLTFYRIVQTDYGSGSPSQIMKRLTAAESADPEQILQGPLRTTLQEHDIWVMILDEEGNKISGLDIPAEIPAHFSIQEIASLSRGYLNDYPVFVGPSNQGLFLVGYPKDSYFKLTSNTFSLKAIKTLPVYIAGTFIFDFLFLFAAYQISKHRIIRDTEPIISAVEKIAEGESVELTTAGDLSDLALSVCKVSQIVNRQSEARAHWISGISHDIRTPLSMIMGYAERIERNPAPAERTKKEAAIIRQQSAKIKDLIQDLNLVSSLEYEMQPLQQTSLYLSRLLRSAAAELLNSGLSERYCLEVCIQPEAERWKMNGDSRLLIRALNNLVQNSIQHNPTGCSILLSLETLSDEVILSVADDGIGISEAKIHELLDTPHYLESTDESLNLRHGLGLFLVRKIVEAHQGTLDIQSKPGAGCTVLLHFPRSQDLISESTALHQPIRKHESH